MQYKSTLVRILIPLALVFLAGACVMILEIVAARLVARHVGSSLYTWTSIIGVVLAGLSLGNWLGGVVADRVPAKQVRVVLAALFTGSSILCLSVLYTHWFVFDLPPDWSWPLRIFTGVTLAFFLPAVTLGMISPIVAKWAVTQGHALGRTLGDLYAWGSIGAIVGTLAAGFLLIPYLGSALVIALVSIVLAAVGVALSVQVWSLTWLFVTLLVTGLGLSSWGWAATGGQRLGLQPPPQHEYFDETAYQTVWVTETEPGVYRVVLDGLTHGYVSPDQPEALHYEYLDIYRAVMLGTMHGNYAPASLLLGGGSYTYPRWLADAFPQARTLVAEIDPGVTRAVRAATGMDADPGFEIRHQDARQAAMDLVQDNARFDYVFGDAFQDLIVPQHLTTLEFMRLLHALLDDDGMVLTNVIDRYTQPAFLGAFIETSAQVFEHVDVFSSKVVDELGSRTTFVVVASKRPLPQARIAEAADALDAKLYRLTQNEVMQARERAGRRVLTDDHAPVEYLLAGLQMARRKP